MAVKRHTTPKRPRKPTVPTATPRRTRPVTPTTSRRGKDILDMARELERQDKRRRKPFR